MLGFHFKKEFYEVDPSKQNVEWANALISDLRINMVPLVDAKEAATNRAYMIGEQDVEKYKKKFHKPDKLPFDFAPLPIFEKHRDIIIAEREKAGVSISLNSLDPTAVEEKEKDRKLLKARSSIEGLMSYIDQSMGGPKYNLLNEKDENGEKIFNGNVEQFDQMGLNPDDPEDLAHFFETWHRLDAEIAAELAANYFVNLNELQEFLKIWLDEILANNVVAGRVYADELTFTPVYKYHVPESIQVVQGRRRDYKDAKAIMVTENMTVHEFLHHVGTELTYDNAMYIINSINYLTHQTYDGLVFSDGTKTSETCRNAIGYDEFLRMKVGVGYIEWKSSQCEVAKVGNNSLGNFKRWPRSQDFKPENPNFSRDEKWRQVTYKAYFLATSQSTQEIFKFGPLFDMETYGPEDEYSGFSFLVYKRPGKSAVKKVRTRIDTMNDAWFRFNWILNKAKPSGTRYNYNVIASIATKMYKGMDEKNAVQNVIQMFQNSIDDFYVNDSLNQKLGGGQNPHFEKKGGLDQAVKDFYEVLLAEDRSIGELLGTNALEPFTPTANEGYRLRLQAMAQSRNATDYVGRMVMSILNGFGRRTLQIVQDMIEFKEDEAYKLLCRAIGSGPVTRLRTLKKIPLHKFNIFVDSFNTEAEKAERKRDAYEAFQKNQIPYHVYLLITSIDNPKRAAQVLAYERNKEEKRKDKQAQQLHQNNMQLEQAKHQFEMQRIDAKNQGIIGGYQEQNKGLLMVAQMDNETKLRIKQMGIDAEPGKNHNRTDEKLREAAEKKRLEKGEPLETDEII